MTASRPTQPPENTPRSLGTPVTLEKVGETVQRLANDPDVLEIHVHPHPSGGWLVTWQYAVLDLDEHYLRLFERYQVMFKDALVFPKGPTP